jgi:hypothetical protein
MPEICRISSASARAPAEAGRAISVRLGAAEFFDPLVEPKRNPPGVLPRDQSWPMDHVLLACLARSNSDNSSSILRRGKLFLISGISIFVCCGAILLAADCCMIFPEVECVAHSHGFSTVCGLSHLPRQRAALGSGTLLPVIKSSRCFICEATCSQVVSAPSDSVLSAWLRIAGRAEARLRFP